MHYSFYILVYSYYSALHTEPATQYMCGLWSAVPGDRSDRNKNACQPSVLFVTYIKNGCSTQLDVSSVWCLPELCGVCMQHKTAQRAHSSHIHSLRIYILLFFFFLFRFFHLFFYFVLFSIIIRYSSVSFAPAHTHSLLSTNLYTITFGGSGILHTLQHIDMSTLRARIAIKKRRERASERAKKQQQYER